MYYKVIQKWIVKQFIFVNIFQPIDHVLESTVILQLF